ETCGITVGVGEDDLVTFGFDASGSGFRSIHGDGRNKTGNILKVHKTVDWQVSSYLVQVGMDANHAHTHASKTCCHAANRLIRIGPYRYEDTVDRSSRTSCTSHAVEFKNPFQRLK